MRNDWWDYLAHANQSKGGMYSQSVDNMMDIEAEIRRLESKPIKTREDVIRLDYLKRQRNANRGKGGATDSGRAADKAISVGKGGAGIVKEGKGGASTYTGGKEPALGLKRGSLNGSDDQNKKKKSASALATANRSKAALTGRR